MVNTIFNLDAIDRWAEKGLYVEYYIINQVENGFRKEVESGDMPPFTYTVVVTDKKKDSEVFRKGLYKKLADGLSEALDHLVKIYKTSN